MLFRKKNLLNENIEYQDNLKNKLNYIIFDIQNNKYLGSLSKDTIDKVLSIVIEALSKIESLVFTGKENIKLEYENIDKAITELKNQLNNDSNNKALLKANDLLALSEKLKLISDGNLSCDIDNNKKECFGVEKKRKLVYEKLTELYSIKNMILEYSKKLENDIQIDEKEKSELEDIMIEEDNERILNELDRKISSIESIIESKNINRSNYSACYELLNNIYSRLNSIVEYESNLSLNSLDRANALLNINALKSVLDSPDKALSILKRMNNDSLKISENIEKIDQKTFKNLDNHNIKATDSAQKRKAELIRKKRERELFNDDLSKMKNIEVVKEDK